VSRVNNRAALAAIRCPSRQDSGGFENSRGRVATYEDRLISRTGQLRAIRPIAVLVDGTVVGLENGPLGQPGWRVAALRTCAGVL
jgi:hypothetical protein